MSTGGLMDNDDHDFRSTSPPALRKQLTQEFGSAPGQSTTNKKKLLQRKASTMTAAMGLGTVDPEVRKRLAPVVIVGILSFKKPVAVADLRSVLKERLLDIPRFLCHVVESENKEVLLEQLPKESVDMEYHVRELQQDKPWGQHQLDEYLSKVYNDPSEMDVSKPLWRFITVPKMEDGRSLVVAILDHALVDGVSAVATLMAILDDDENTPAGAAAPATKRIAGPSLSFARRFIAFVGGVKQALLGPILPSDPPNKLKEKDHRNPGKDKACGFGETVSLESMKQIKQKFPGASVNDVMLATLTLTIRRYFAEIGEKSTKVRANFPMNMRPAKQNVLAESMGNRFSSGVFNFPVEIQDPIAVIWSVKKQIDMIKRSPAPLIQDKLLSTVVPLLVKTGLRQQLVDTILDTYGKVTCMLSNVPGPSQQVSLCRQPVEDLMFYAFTPLGVYFGILSYNGRVNFGIVSGKTIEPDASRIAKHWAPAFKELEQAVAKIEKPEPPADYSDLMLLSGLLACAVGVAMKMGWFSAFKPGL